MRTTIPHQSYLKLAAFLLLLIVVLSLPAQKSDVVLDKANVFATKYNSWAAKRNERVAKTGVGRLLDLAEARLWAEVVDSERALEKEIKKEYEAQ